MPPLQRVTPKLRALILERDGYTCGYDARPLEGGFYSIQHRKARGQGGTRDPLSSDPRNLISMCGSGTTGCHGWMEANPARARELGWRIDTYTQLDVPLITKLGTRIVLLPDGSREDVWPQTDLLPSEV